MARIADLMLEIGRARASGIAGAGQAYGQSVASLGGILRDYRQGKLQDQELADNRQFRTDQMTLARNRDTRDAAAETRATTAFNTEQGYAATQHAMTLHDYSVRTLASVLDVPEAEKPAAWAGVRTGLISRGIAKPEEIPDAYPGDDAVRGEMNALLSIKDRMELDKPITLGEGQIAVSPRTGARVATGQPKTPSYQQKDVLLDGKPAIVSFDPSTGNSVDANGVNVTTRVKPMPPASVTYPKDESAVALSPEGLDAAAMMFGKTGQLPPMGMGKAAADARTRIINRAAVLIPGLDIASAKADFAANQDSEKALQKQLDAVTSFEETATKNLGLFITAAEKIPDSGSPILNRPIRTLSDSLFGSPEMATFNAQRRTVIPEFAKILNNPNLSGQLSDSARHEIEEVMSGNATLKQMVATAKALVQDTTNRKTSMTQQLQAIRARIKKGSDAPATSQAPAAPAGWKYVPKAGGGWTAVEDK